MLSYLFNMLLALGQGVSCTATPTHYTRILSSFISTHSSNLRHILHMLVGLFNLFIAVYSMIGYGVVCVLFSIIFKRSSSIARLCQRVGRSSLTGLRHFVQSVFHHAPYSSIWLTPYSSCLTTGCLAVCFADALHLVLYRFFSCFTASDDHRFALVFLLLVAQLLAICLPLRCNAPFFIFQYAQHRIGIQCKF